jgi:hypothetical protein
MEKKKQLLQQQQENDANYTFLLQYMAAVTTAALVTAAIITATTLNVGATTAALAATSIFAFTPLLPIALVALALICILPFLFIGNGTTNGTTTVHLGNPNYTTGYGGATFFSTTIPRVQTYATRVHTHYDRTIPQNGRIHEHRGPDVIIHQHGDRGPLHQHTDHRNVTVHAHHM